MMPADTIPKNAMEAYRKMCHDKIVIFHPRQYQLLEDIHDLCTHHKRSWWLWRGLSWRWKALGVYLYGSVGCGKTLIMDLLYQSFVGESVRMHFHTLMLWMHQDLGQDDQGKWRSLPQFLEHMMNGKRFLFLDEFMVENIANMALMKTMFEHLWRKGIVVMTTSNVAVENLYQGGVGREHFQDFFHALKKNMLVLETQIDHDYRQGHKLNAGIYHCPPHGDRASLRRLFEQQSHGKSQIHVLTIAGRKRLHRTLGKNLWVRFEDLCGSSIAPTQDFHEGRHAKISQSPYGAKDYQALLQIFDGFFLADLPLLEDEQEATQRFIVLIDGLYQEKKRLYFSSDVLLEKIFLLKPHDSIALKRCASRIMEMGSSRYRKTLAS